MVQKTGEEKIRKALQKFYKKQAVEHLSKRTKELSVEIGLFPKKISFIGAKTRWGSCSSEGHISLNWKLMVAPPVVVDYIIIHELAH